MHQLTIYHNPNCSKSRETLALLRNKGIEPTVIDYLQEPLARHQLQALLQHFEMNELVRTNEKCFIELGLSLDDEEQIIDAILQNPILLQRPIVIYQNQAIIGRPPEKVLTLF